MALDCIMISDGLAVQGATVSVALVVFQFSYKNQAQENVNKHF